MEEIVEKKKRSCDLKYQLDVNTSTNFFIFNISHRFVVVCVKWVKRK